MNKEFLEQLIQFAKEFKLMNLPVEQVLHYYDMYTDYLMDRYIWAICE